MRRQLPTIAGYGLVFGFVSAKSYQLFGSESTLAFVIGAVYGFVIAVGVYHYHR